MDETTLRLEEDDARRLVLARVIDEADTQGRLLSEVERRQLELAALAASRSRTAGPLDAAGYLRERARRVMEKIEVRQPRIAALQDPEPWRAWLAWAMPLAACLLGALIDRIDNPRQVNMLSPALLAVLFWNLAAYVALAVGGLLRPWRGRERPGLAQHVMQRAMGAARGGRPVRASFGVDVATRFRRHWWQLTGPRQGLWLQQVLHATAAGWAVGLALSIVIGGLVRDYRVGWESTLLDVHQVHTFLSLLFAPVLALMPADLFTVGELERMAFRSGAPLDVAGSRRWIWLYLALLLLVVVLPRTLLALVAYGRRLMLGCKVDLDLRDPYFEQVLSRVTPARVTLAVLSSDPAAHDVLLHVLRDAGQARGRPVAGVPWTVASTPQGDELRWLELPPGYEPPAPGRSGGGRAPATAQAWLQDMLVRWRSTDTAAVRPDVLQAALQDADLVLFLPGAGTALRERARLLRWMGAPIIALADGPAGAESLREHVQALGLNADVRDWRTCCGNWTRDAALAAAIRSRLPDTRHAGFDRLAAAWSEANEERLRRAMTLLARMLANAAREAQEVQGASSSALRRLVSAQERESDGRARQQAMQAVLQRLHEGEMHTLSELLRLHGVEEPLPLAAHEATGPAFVVQQPVERPQAGVTGAGAATGAAMGAGIDLVTGGLTLGAAAALGAVLGGSAAYVAAAWRNRASPGGATLVQLSDDMLQTLTEAALLRYLGVIHQGRGGEELTAAPPAHWRSEVVAAVEEDRDELLPLWATARAETEPVELVPALAVRLEALARSILGRV